MENRCRCRDRAGTDRFEVDADLGADRHPRRDLALELVDGAVDADQLEIFERGVGGVDDLRHRALEGRSQDTFSLAVGGLGPLGRHHRGLLQPTSRPRHTITIIIFFMGSTLPACSRNCRVTQHYIRSRLVPVPDPDVNRGIRSYLPDTTNRVCRLVPRCQVPCRKRCHMSGTIAVRRETKSPLERRTPITPDLVARSGQGLGSRDSGAAVGAPGLQRQGVRSCGRPDGRKPGRLRTSSWASRRFPRTSFRQTPPTSSSPTSSRASPTTCRCWPRCWSSAAPSSTTRRSATKPENGSSSSAASPASRA